MLKIIFNHDQPNFSLMIALYNDWQKRSRLNSKEKYINLMDFNKMPYFYLTMKRKKGKCVPKRPPPPKIQWVGTEILNKHFENWRWFTIILSEHTLFDKLIGILDILVLLFFFYTVCRYILYIEMDNKRFRLKLRQTKSGVFFPKNYLLFVLLKPSQNWSQKKNILQGLFVILNRDLFL